MDPHIANSTGLSNEEITAAADAAQAMPNQNLTSQDLEAPKQQDSDADIWGIKGLLGIIKVEDSDKSKLALGVDLTTLGLNMNQPEYVPAITIFNVVCVRYTQTFIRRGKIYRDFLHFRNSTPSTIYPRVIE